MGAQKPGFFTKIQRLQPADSVKNPVSLVGVRPGLVKKEVGKNVCEQTQRADGGDNQLKSLVLTRI